MITHNLVAQTKFNGTPEELLMMQEYECAYLNNEAKVTDEEWEALKKKFSYKETLFPSEIKPNSRKRSLIKHINSSHSLVKIDSIKELKERLDAIPDEDFKSGIIVEPKLDGVALSLFYIKSDNMYVLYKMSTRGDGIYGKKINEYALAGVQNNIPKTLSLNYDDEIIEIRGELVIPINDFTMNKYAKDPVWRNIVAGMVNRVIPSNTMGILIYAYNNGELVGIEHKSFEEIDKNVEIIGSSKKYMYSLYADSIQFSTEKINMRKLKAIWNPTNNKIKFQYDTEEQSFDYVQEVCKFFAYSIDREDTSANICAYSELKGTDVPLASKDINPEGKDIFYINNNLDKESVPEIKKQIISFAKEFYGVDDNDNIISDSLKDTIAYPIDGLVFKPKKYNSTDMKNAIGYGEKSTHVLYPNNQFALKLKSKGVTAEIDKITFSITEKGNETVSCTLKNPIKMPGGATVSKINLFNRNWLEQRPWIYEGAVVEVYMSRDIIPTIIPK